MARARFNAQVVVKVAKMNRGGIGEGHLRRDFAISIANPLAVLFQKFRESRLSYAEMFCLERLPNLFAACESSGIVASRFMANEILEPRSFPCFRLFTLFYSVTVEQDREKRKLNPSVQPLFTRKCRHSSVGRAADL